jgi:PPOX class probable F420-dependent enzyme
MTGLDFTTEFGKRALGRLQQEQVVWLTTVSATGAPQPSPVWFLWQDDKVIIYSQPDTAKIRAIAQNDRVSLNFNATEHGDDVVVLNGTAEIIGIDPPASDNRAYIEKYAGGLASVKMSPEQFSAEYSQLISVTPRRMRGF